jgi:hypothetical protein
MQEAIKASARDRAQAQGLLFVTKDLAPSSINTLTTDKDIGGRKVKSEVARYWIGKGKKRYKLKKKQVDYLVNLMGWVTKVPKGGKVTVTPPPFEKKDVAQIAKDYSEVLAGIWCTTANYPEGIGKVNFPGKNSLPVADILVPDNTGGVNLVSVKTKSGSPTSFKGIWDIARKSGFLTNKKFMKQLSPIQQEMVDLVEIILAGTTYGHAIDIAKYLYKTWDTDDGEHFGLVKLSQITGTPVTRLSDDSLEKWLQTFGKDTKKIRKALAPFYKAIGKNPAATEWAKYNTKKQRHKSEKIQSPLAYHLVDWFNELYAEALTSLMNTFRDIQQVNVDLDTKGNLSVQMQTFPEIKFKFANAGNSTNSRNKIGFKKA